MELLERSSRIRIAAVLWTLVGLGPAMSCGGGARFLGGLRDGGTSAGDAARSSSDIAEDRSPGETVPQELCGASGSWLLPTARGEVCSGQVAAQAFRFALCTCTELSWVGALTTDSFNSATGQRGSNADVGVDGYVVAAQAYQIGGSFWIAGEPAGAPGLRVVGAAPSVVAKDLRVGGGIVGQGLQSVQRDLFSEGDIICPGLNVGGAVHVPPGTLVAGAIASRGIVQEPVTVEKPCNCATPALDIVRAADSFRETNDNAANGISPTALNAFTGPRILDLACGRYHFEQITGRDLTLRLHGRVAISVTGDLAVGGAFKVELAPGGELDLFVRGEVRFLGTMSFGNTAEPAKVRVYVAGASVALPVGMIMGANLYAPTSLVSSGGPLEMFGALIANRFSFAGSVTVHYDEAVLGARGCP